MTRSRRRYIALSSMLLSVMLALVTIGALMPAVTAPTYSLPSEGATSRPDLCLTIGLGGNAAFECGNLRIAHALPTTTTYSKARTPVLTYNSRHAAPFVLVPVDVKLPGGGTTPSKVTVKLTSGGVTLAQGAWTGSAWTSGSPTCAWRQVDGIALPGQTIVLGGLADRSKRAHLQGSVAHEQSSLWIDTRAGPPTSFADAVGA